MDSLSYTPRPKLALCALLTSQVLAQSLLKHLQSQPPTEIGDRFQLNQFEQQSDFLSFIQQTYPAIDCLIVEHAAMTVELVAALQTQSILIPAIVLVPPPSEEVSPSLATSIIDSQDEGRSLSATLYHTAVLQVDTDHINQIYDFIEEAIAKFLNLSSTSSLSSDPSPDILMALTAQRSLLQQQQRLAEKLKERLGYLGVYYKRNPAHFLRHMNELERQELLQQLRLDYRHIILRYFAEDENINQSIDNFVNLAFFADIPVAHIVGIHMDLMDEFSKQLKLEGRSEEILLDYRLTLIDTLAHLCEMYRRSIPRES